MAENANASMDANVTITSETPRVLEERSSESLGQLAAALSKAQGQMHAAEKAASNPFFKSKYMTLTSVWEAIRKPLSDNELAVVQSAASKKNMIKVRTKIIHSSGEWVSDCLEMTAKDGSPQALGSALTYARRYSLAAMVGVVADEDDDGNAAQPQRGRQ